MEAARREDWRRDSAISMGSLGGESLRKASPPKEPPVLDERHESWHQTVTQKMLHKVRSSISSIFDLAAIGESELKGDENMPLTRSETPINPERITKTATNSTVSSSLKGRLRHYGSSVIERGPHQSPVPVPDRSSSSYHTAISRSATCNETSSIFTASEQQSISPSHRRFKRPSIFKLSSRSRKMGRDPESISAYDIASPEDPAEVVLLHSSPIPIPAPNLRINLSCTPLSALINGEHNDRPRAADDTDTFLVGTEPRSPAPIAGDIPPTIAYEQRHGDPSSPSSSSSRRPSEATSEHIRHLMAPLRADTDLEVLSGTQDEGLSQALPTPMPGTTFTLDDPFIGLSGSEDETSTDQQQTVTDLVESDRGKIHALDGHEEPNSQVDSTFAAEPISPASSLPTTQTSVLERRRHEDLPAMERRVSADLLRKASVAQDIPSAETVPDSRGIVQNMERQSSRGSSPQEATVPPNAPCGNLFCNLAASKASSSVRNEDASKLPLEPSVYLQLPPYERLKQITAQDSAHAAATMGRKAATSAVPIDEDSSQVFEPTKVKVGTTSGRHTRTNLWSAMNDMTTVPMTDEATQSAPPRDETILKNSKGEWVKLVCDRCPERFSGRNKQGFINHYRIKHGHNFKNHNDAADQCGEPVDMEDFDVSLYEDAEKPKYFTLGIPSSFKADLTDSSRRATEPSESKCLIYNDPNFCRGEILRLIRQVEDTEKRASLLRHKLGLANNKAESLETKVKSLETNVKTLEQRLATQEKVKDLMAHRGIAQPSPTYSELERRAHKNALLYDADHYHPHRQLAPPISLGTPPMSRIRLPTPPFNLNSIGIGSSSCSFCRKRSRPEQSSYEVEEIPRTPTPEISSLPYLAQGRPTLASDPDRQTGIDIDDCKDKIAALIIKEHNAEIQAEFSAAELAEQNDEESSSLSSLSDEDESYCPSSDEESEESSEASEEDSDASDSSDSAEPNRVVSSEELPIRTRVIVESSESPRDVTANNRSRRQSYVYYSDSDSGSSYVDSPSPSPKPLRVTNPDISEDADEKPETPRHIEDIDAYNRGDLERGLNPGDVQPVADFVVRHYAHETETPRQVQPITNSVVRHHALETEVPRHIEGIHGSNLGDTERGLSPRDVERDPNLAPRGLPLQYAYVTETPRHIEDIDAYNRGDLAGIHSPRPLHQRGDHVSPRTADSTFDDLYDLTDDEDEGQALEPLLSAHSSSFRYAGDSDSDSDSDESVSPLCFGDMPVQVTSVGLVHVEPSHPVDPQADRSGSSANDAPAIRQPGFPQTCNLFESPPLSCSSSVDGVRGSPFRNRVGNDSAFSSFDEDLDLATRARSLLGGRPPTPIPRMQIPGESTASRLRRFSAPSAPSASVAASTPSRIEGMSDESILPASQNNSTDQPIGAPPVPHDVSEGQVIEIDVQVGTVVNGTWDEDTQTFTPDLYQPIPDPQSHADAIYKYIDNMNTLQFV